MTEPTLLQQARAYLDTVRMDDSPLSTHGEIRALAAAMERVLQHLEQQQAAAPVQSGVRTGALEMALELQKRITQGYETALIEAEQTHDALIHELRELVRAYSLISRADGGPIAALKELIAKYDPTGER